MSKEKRVSLKIETYLPNELFYEIFLYLESEFIFSTILIVSKKWYSLASSEPMNRMLCKSLFTVEENKKAYSELGSWLKVLKYLKLESIREEIFFTLKREKDSISKEDLSTFSQFCMSKYFGDGEIIEKAKELFPSRGSFLHCKRCHEYYYENYNTDESCIIEHDEEYEEYDDEHHRTDCTCTYVLRCCGASVLGSDDDPPDIDAFSEKYCFIGRHENYSLMVDYDDVSKNIISCKENGCEISDDDSESD